MREDLELKIRARSPPKPTRKGSIGGLNGFLMAGIISVAVILILLGLFSTTKRAAMNEFTDAECSGSVKAASLMRITQVKAFQEEIRCETKTKVITERQPDYVNQQIADALAGC
jgi:hypothetical protein